MTVMNGFHVTTQDPIETLYQRITELEQANHALRMECAAARAARQQSDALLHSVVKHVPNALAIFDQDMRYVLVSDRFLTDYEIADQEVIGRSHYDVFPDIPQRWREIHQRSLAGSIERAEEDVFERDDGTIIYNRWECRPWYTSQGGIGGIIMITEVTTDRKRIEEELRQLNAELEQRVMERTVALQQSRQLLQHVIDNLPLKIVVVDAQRRYLLVNKDGAAQFGLTPTEMIGKYEDDFFPPEVVAQWQMERQELETSRTPMKHRDQLLISGELRDFLLIKFPIYDDQQNLYAFGDIAMDITAQVQQEAELRLFRTIVECAPDGIGFTDIHGTILYSNPAHRQLFGYGDEIIGMASVNTVAVDEYGRHQEIMQQLLTEGTWRGEGMQRRKDGSTFPAELSVFVVPADNPAQTRIAAIVRDISERKQVEEGLRITNERLERSFESTPLATIELDRAGIIQHWNRSAERIFGWSAAEVLGQEALPLIVPDFNRDQIQDVLATLFSGQATNSRNANITRDGRVIMCQWYNAVLRDSAGHVTGVMCQAEDVTAQVQHEAELRLFKMIVERANDAIAFVDANSTITFSNPAHRALLKYGDEIIGTPLLQTIDPQEHSRLEAITHELLEQGSWRGELIHYCKDGTSLPCEVSVFPIADDNPANTRMVGILRDISDRKRAEAERAALQQQIIDTQRATLHELSTPLIPLSERIVVMPLVGAIDSARAQQIMDTLLEGTARHRSDVVILDITGVQMVDTQVANALLRAAQAVKLLGAQIILTGIRPHIAQTLVSLGIDLRGIVTRSTLQTGVAYALERFGRA